MAKKKTYEKGYQKACQEAYGLLAAQLKDPNNVTKVKHPDGSVSDYVSLTAIRTYAMTLLYLGGNKEIAEKIKNYAEELEKKYANSEVATDGSSKEV